MVESTHLPITDFQTALLQIDRIRAAEIFDSVYLKAGSFGTLEHLIMEALEKIGVD